jgi:hypothetical protein
MKMAFHNYEVRSRSASEQKNVVCVTMSAVRCNSLMLEPMLALIEGAGMQYPLPTSCDKARWHQSIALRSTTQIDYHHKEQNIQSVLCSNGEILHNYMSTLRNAVDTLSEVIKSP